MIRQIFLPGWATFFLDILVWAIVHLSIGYVFSKLPVGIFHPENAYFRAKKWEKDGKIYQRFFRIKAWKKYIPSGASVYRNAYQIKKIGSFDLENLKTWQKESCRSEACHIAMIFPGFFFFLWNNIQVGWLMVAYAFSNNLVPIIMQRYNRPRVKKIIHQIETRQNKELETL